MGTNRFMIGKINIRIYVLVNTSKDVRLMCLMTRTQKTRRYAIVLADVLASVREEKLRNEAFIPLANYTSTIDIHRQSPSELTRKTQ
jgi:hypothetical protein